MSKALNMSAVEQAAREQKKIEEAKIFDVGGEGFDVGSPDSLRYRVLTSIVGENYDGAHGHLNKFFDKESPYPNFHEKAKRLISHCIDLVFAIKAKRNFAGLSSLTRPKQQELRQKYIEHLKELQYTLKRIEKVESDLRIADARSTIYIVKAIWLSAFALAIVAFVTEVYRGLALTSFLVIEDYYDKLIAYIFKLLGS